MEQTLEKKPVHIFIPYAVLVTALFAFFITYVNKVPPKQFETEYPEMDFIAPSFELPSLSGGKVNLKDYRGKVVFINFWATWCATCKVEMPSMQKVYDQFKDRGRHRSNLGCVFSAVSGPKFFRWRREVLTSEEPSGLR